MSQILGWPKSFIISHIKLRRNFWPTQYFTKYRYTEKGSIHREFRMDWASYLFFSGSDGHSSWVASVSDLSAPQSTNPFFKLGSVNITLFRHTLLCFRFGPLFIPSSHCSVDTAVH